jgi:transcriptional regulator of aromatic amino acid metabolism
MQSGDGLKSAKVLVTGESGVGKEIVARLIHANSARWRAPLITVNCAALTDTLLETEQAAQAPSRNRHSSNRAPVTPISVVRTTSPTQINLPDAIDPT